MNAALYLLPATVPSVTMPAEGDFAAPAAPKWMEWLCSCVGGGVRMLCECECGRVACGGGGVAAEWPFSCGVVDERVDQ